MDAALTRLVWGRAGGRCEYCGLAQADSALPFEIDHVIARKHGGRTAAGNLALSCFYCNSYKGPNIAGRDPRTRAVTRLFHPRRHKWARHFRWDGPVLVGRTPLGRTTVAVLNINEPEAVATRAALIEAGRFPP
jgi:HNH endonuclease